MRRCIPKRQDQGRKLAATVCPSRAVEDALRLGTISFDAVRHLLLCRIEQRPPRLDMDNWPHLPLARVRTTQAADYMVLLPCMPAGTAHSDAEAEL